jgi:hypothetical protein
MHMALAERKLLEGFTHENRCFGAPRHMHESSIWLPFPTSYLSLFKQIQKRHGNDSAKDMALGEVLILSFH